MAERKIREVRGKGMKDPLYKYLVSQKALEFYDHVMEDTDALMKDIRGREVARQLVKAAGSISANFEEGFGRGTTKEFIYHLNVSKGSARESKGWYWRSQKFLPRTLIGQRQKEADEIIALLASTVTTLKSKQK